MKTPRLFRLLAAASLLLGTSGSVLAQDEDAKSKPFQEPGIGYKKESTSKPYIDWLFATLLIAGSAFVLFKNPHRSHMD